MRPVSVQLKRHLDAVVVKPVTRVPVQLKPIEWGKPDPQLAKALCWHISDAPPAIVIRFNPFTHRRIAAFLRSCGIVH